MSTEVVEDATTWPRTERRRAHRNSHRRRFDTAEEGTTETALMRNSGDPVWVQQSYTGFSALDSSYDAGQEPGSHDGLF